MKASRILLLLSFCLPAIASATLPRPTAAAFDKGATITVSGYTGSASLSGFPVLVRIAAGSPAGFAYSDLHSQTDGADLAFIAMDGSGLPFEIDTWDPNGTSLVWVKLPTMGQGTQFVMCWGSASSGKTVCPDSPFADYVGVWHMSEASGTVADATGHGLGAEPAGATQYSIGVSGKIGGARQNSTTQSGRVYLLVPNYNDRGVGSSFTVSGWFNSKGVPSSDMRLFSRKYKYTDSGGWEVLVKESGKSPKVRGGTNAKQVEGTFNPVLKDTGWQFVTFVFDGTTATTYQNGSLVKTGEIVAATDNGQPLGIGSYGGGTESGSYFIGDMDEARLRPGAVTADWIAADYAAQSSASFLTLGAAEAYGANPDPMGAAVVSDVAYTNASLAVTVTSVGDGASRADVTVAVSATADFASPLWTTSYSVTGSDSRSFDLMTLSTGTTYRVRATIANALGNSLVLEPDPFTTLAPGAPEAAAAFTSRGATTLSASGTVADLGTGARSGAVRLEASTDGFATVAAATPDETVVPGEARTFTVAGLEPGTAYALRLRVENDWGLVTVVPLDGTFSTRGAPISAAGIGHRFSADGATVELTFAVSAVYDGAACTAVLTYDGRTIGPIDFNEAGTLRWPGVAAAARAAQASVAVTALAGGRTYEQTWTATIAPGTAGYALSTLADLAGAPLRVGDSATLPELDTASDRYELLSVRPFALGADGRTLTALEPGFASVVAFRLDPASGTLVRDPAMGLAVCVPEPAGSGRVFLALPKSGNWSWASASNWTNLTDGAAGYPDGADDVAIAPLANNAQLDVNASVTVGELYFGFNETGIPGGISPKGEATANETDNSQSVRLRSTNGSTLTFRSTAAGRPALLRFCNLGNTNVLARRPHLYVGGGTLSFAQQGDLTWDCGAWPDYTDLAIRNQYGRYRCGTDGTGTWTVPAGATLRIENVTGFKSWSDDQGPNATFWLGSGLPFAGAGTIVYEGPASANCNRPFVPFEGTVVVRNKQAWDMFSMGSRGGSFWLGNKVTTEIAADATMMIEGHAGYSSGLAIGHSCGAVSAGNSHGHGSWAATSNPFPQKALVLNGGFVRQPNMNNTGWTDAAGRPICVPNGADRLVVSNGLSAFELTSNSNADRPTNRLAFAALEHAGDGVLHIRSDRMYNSYNKSLARDYVVVRGFAGHAIGGTGTATYSISDANAANVVAADAPIVPWIVSCVQSVQSLRFLSAAADGTLVAPGHPASKALDSATNPNENVRVNAASAAISANRTVNSLTLENNSSKVTALGAGRTLTITSGGLILGSSGRTILGSESDYAAGTAGTVYFPRKAYVWTARNSDTEPNELWAKIVAPEGAVFSYPLDLRIGGDQTGIDDHISVNGTDLRLGSATTGCEIDVPVHLYGGNSMLRVGKQGSFCGQDLWFWDHGTPGSKFEPAAGTVEPVHMIRIDGVPLRRGTWGSSESPAEFIDDNHFAGTGVAQVQIDSAPSSAIFLY